MKWHGHDKRRKERRNIVTCYECCSGNQVVAGKRQRRRTNQLETLMCIYRVMKSVEIKVEDTGQDRVEESNPKQFRLPHAGDGKIITARKYQYEKVN